MLTDVNLRCNLKYVAWELPGALPNAWLEEECLSRLNRANQAILEKTAGQAELLVWDALRDFETQEHLFNVEIEKATRTHPELNSEAVYEKVCSYVRPPSREIPPPHTTGGAVDVTLWVNGSDALLGKFDDFSAAGRSDYYDHYDPKTPHEARQKEYRKILADSMSAAGFSGIPEEWWHWEFGTRHWANANGKEVLYDEVQLPPKKPGVVHGLPVGPRKFMIDVHGIAQAFSSPEERAAALNGENAAHYYARTRHHNEQQLVSTLKGIVGAPAGVCFPTGLSAALASVCATTPMGGTVVVDNGTYYETVANLEAISKQEGWQLYVIDLTDRQALKEVSDLEPDVIFLDHPHNWLLSTVDITAVRESVSREKTIIVVDTSVQPLQREILGERADIVVVSLSKYPSQGETMGGVALAKPEIAKQLTAYASTRGLILAPEAAATVAVGITSLEDRMASYTQKAEALAEFLAAQPEVAEVRLPDLSSTGALSGGQLSVTFLDVEFAKDLEVAVGWNSGNPQFPFVLACTFGAPFTTFERFSNRVSSEAAISPLQPIPDEMVRIGIGGETAEELLSAIEFLFGIVRLNKLETKPGR